MKTTMKIVLGVAILLVVAGVIGNIFFNDLSGMNFFGRSRFSRSGMMYGYYDTNNKNDEKLDLEILEENVESYISKYNENLVISDIFIFEDSDYYFSIMEEDTAFGAMELLVNPYSGDVYPEFGPNMMWNLKYGMHNNSGYGMMNTRYIMGGSRYRFNNWPKDIDENTISHEAAQKLASEYVEKNTSDDYTVSQQGHEFYGYYTFHIEDGHDTAGMLSVNGLTGDVWYHDWHGIVSDIIDGHEKDDNH